MGTRALKRRSVRAGLVGVVAAALVAAAASFAGAGGSGYSVKKLVSDQAGVAAHTDTNLVNSWGLVHGPQTPWWVANNGTNVSTLYDGSGTPLPLVVHVAGSPTGAVFNGSKAFVVHESGGSSGPSLFMFATESGTILGWSPAVPPPPLSSQAFTVVDLSASGAVFKGLAIASTSSGRRLYATDFHNGQVDVFNGRFKQLIVPGAFMDPSLPSGYAPFGIRNIGGTLFVTYAKQDADAHDDAPGPGHGFVDMYDTSGKLLGRVATRGALNSPWGLAMAPKSFGEFAGDLLIGNFGDGKINAYEPESTGGFHLEGSLRRQNGSAIAIDGLWALSFGNGNAAGPRSALFFTAGPDHEAHGLFGKITVAS